MNIDLARSVGSKPRLQHTGTGSLRLTCEWIEQRGLRPGLRLHESDRQQARKLKKPGSNPVAIQEAVQTGIACISALLSPTAYRRPPTGLTTANW
jgi:hypothetical protein